MPELSLPRANYDRIAHLYDLDMARNMAFDDVAFYARLAQRANGRVLELGCGNGRILLDLLARGIDVVGVDSSAGMLAQLVQKATTRGLMPKVCRMDARALAFGEQFALVLCPYSLITYMTGALDAARLLAAVRDVLAEGSTIIVDAFIPRASPPGAGYRLDYRREHRDTVLTRSKRVAAIAPNINRIERRYDLVASDGRLVERIETCEDVREYAPQELVHLLATSGFSVEQEWWNYGATDGPVGAQFFTLSACKAR
jgi:SAM-dependent methyltransferase